MFMRLAQRRRILKTRCLFSAENGAPEMIVCAVPYLRDRDIRVAEAGESIEDKERKLIEGIPSIMPKSWSWPNRNVGR